jgi:hypothetical protein
MVCLQGPRITQNPKIELGSCQGNIHPFNISDKSNTAGIRSICRGTWIRCSNSGKYQYTNLSILKWNPSTVLNSISATPDDPNALEKRAQRWVGSFMELWCQFYHQQARISLLIKKICFISWFLSLNLKTTLKKNYF